MMLRAYNEHYVYDAMRNLGEAMDYAVYQCNISMDTFMDLFIVGGFAAQFGSGVPKYVCGMSGTELVCNVLEKSGLQMNLPKGRVIYERTPEYWCGWVLAYYQWYSAKTFKEIKQIISMTDVEKLYPTLHEAAEDKFVAVLDAIIESQKKATNLQLLRRVCGYSQKILAEKSGVTLRSIQQYEQRVKDINKAAGITLLSLAQILGCKVEDLLEKN